LLKPLSSAIKLSCGKKRTPPPEVETMIRCNEEVVAVGGRTLLCLDSSKQNPENTTAVPLQKKIGLLSRFKNLPKNKKLNSVA
jgi:hypothetical protein